MRKSFIAVSLLLSLVSVLDAEDRKPFLYERYPQALGLFRGDAGGTGLNYQTWMGKFGISVAAGAYYDPAGNAPVREIFGNAMLPKNTSPYYNCYTLIYNLGFEGQYMVYEEDFADWLSGCLYLFLATSHHGEQYFVRKYDNPPSELKPIEFGWVTAGGIGVEPVFFQHFSLALECGFALYSSGTIPFSSVSLVGLTGQAGLRYRF